MNKMFPKYETELFCEIYDNAEDFVEDYKACGLYDDNNKITDDNAALLFYLLYGQYANNPIANYDINQFKYKLWSIIFKFGPAWEKRLDIQHTLRTLSESELLTGAQAINAHAYAMGDDQVAADTDPVKIDQKSSTKYTKAKLDAYSQLWEVLRTDVTGEFIGKFKVCFKQFVIPEHPTIFETEIVPEPEVEDED